MSLSPRQHWIGVLARALRSELIPTKRPCATPITN